MFKKLAVTAFAVLALIVSEINAAKPTKPTEPTEPTEPTAPSMCLEMKTRCHAVGGTSASHSEACNLRYSACVNSNIWIAMCKDVVVQGYHRRVPKTNEYNLMPAVRQEYN